MAKAKKSAPKPKNPTVYFEMDDGRTMVAKLYPETAPNTVNNFIDLANKGFYDGTIFHRVVPGFCAQCGDPKGTGSGGAGYTLYGEFSANGHLNLLKHELGVISMARTEKPDSASSQFFFCLDDAKKTYTLNGFYAGFGRVIEGLDVLLDMNKLEIDSESERPTNPPAIKSVRVDTFGVEYPEPKKIGTLGRLFKKKERTKPVIVF